MWARLSAAITQIQQHNISQLSYEEHYRYAYSLILNQQGDMLYAGVRRQVAEHLAHQLDTRLVPLFPLEEAQVQEAMSAFPSTSPRLAHTLGLLPGGDASVLHTVGASERFLHALTDLWDDHNSCMSKIRDVLKYVDRVYVPNQQRAPIWDVGLDLFRDTVVRSSRQPCYAQLMVTLLRHVYCEREGTVVERRTLKAITDMLLSLSHAPDVSVYVHDWEPLFLRCSSEYYTAEAVRLLGLQQATHYLEQAERRLAEEEARVTACFSPSTWPALQALVEQHLLTDHLDEVLAMPSGGLVALLEADARPDLQRLYRLFARVQPGLPALHRALREYVATRGRRIQEASATPREGPAAPPLEVALAWVEQVLALQAQLDGVLYTSFAGDKSCEAAINEAVESLVNMQARAPEFLSLFIDEHLKKGSRAVADMERVLTQTITLFRFVHEKDVFERYYKLHLTRRLLHGRSASDEAERGMIARLKVEGGHSYVQKLQGMLNDMKLSEEVLQAFEREQARAPAPRPWPMQVRVLTATYWPITAPAQPPVLPPVLAEACSAFEQFYASRHRGRVLTWQPSLGTADVRVQFRARAHELSLSTYALMVLLLFEQTDTLAYRSIRAATQMSDVDLQRTLQSLACAKYKILRKEPKGRDVHEADSFTFNADFTCPLARIKIAQVAAKVETPGERQATTAKVEEERKNQVEACIVRIMKSRQQLAHNELVNEVVRQLLPRFQPSPALIKKRIESLLDRAHCVLVPRVGAFCPFAVLAMLPASERVMPTETAPEAAAESSRAGARPPSAGPADEFLARAQALGLRLSRTDYERTRAGVAAFLKAERLPTSSHSTLSADPSDEADRSAPPTDPDVTPQLSQWLRTPSGQLNFFTAIVHPMANDEQRARLSLDEVGSAEEKRRRRLRRRRLLEKQMLLETGATSPVPSLSDAPPSPTGTVRTSDAPELESPVSLGTMRSSTPIGSRGPRASTPGSPEIHLLNRMARVDADGKLWLASRAQEAEPCSEDSALSADESLATMDEPDSSLAGWGPRAGAPTEQLNTYMKNMSLLDRIMLSKTSPRRIRREAKARERQCSETDEARAALPAADASVSHWADVSSDSMLDASADSGPPAQVPRPSHSRHPSASLRWSSFTTATPLHRSTYRTAATDDITDLSPLASVTPLSRFDPGTQITPMRYSPGLSMDYSHPRPSSLAFSPNLLTPWTHHGRLLSNAGLSHLPSSPFVSGEWGTSSHMAASAETVRGSFAFSSTPLSHLPAHDTEPRVAATSSPSRLQCIESFPGRSPQARDLLDSPVAREHAPSPLANKGLLRAASSSASPSKPTASLLSPLWISQTAALQDTAAAPSELDSRWRRTDTIRPADVFGTTAALEPHAPTSVFAPRDSADSDSDEALEHAASTGSPSPHRTRQALPRMRLPRRKSGAARATPVAPAAAPQDAQDVFAQGPTSVPAFRAAIQPAVPPTDPKQTEWDQPDGSRIVKLVSEELQAALDAGSLEQEPAPRYFRLPPGHGTSKAKPSSVSYAGLIGQAILSSSDGRLSLAEIYSWISSVYPYYERGDRGWQNSIRHNLSLNKSFVKLERESTIPGKGGWWAIESGHEHRFHNGLYMPHSTGAATTAPPARTMRVSASAPDERARKKRTPFTPPSVRDADQAHAPSSEGPADAAEAHPSFKRPKTARPARFAPPVAMHAPGPARDGASSPVPSPNLSQDRTEADSFDTSTSRSLLATPGRTSAPAYAGVSVPPSGPKSPSVSVQGGASAVSLLPSSLSQPRYPATMPEYGVVYMAGRDMTDYAVPMTSSPSKASGYRSGVPVPLTQPGLPPVPIHGMAPAYPLSAPVPLVPATYSRYASDPTAPSTWRDSDTPTPW